MVSGDQKREEEGGEKKRTEISLSKLRPASKLSGRWTLASLENLYLDDNQKLAIFADKLNQNIVFNALHARLMTWVSKVTSCVVARRRHSRYLRLCSTSGNEQTSKIFHDTQSASWTGSRSKYTSCQGLNNVIKPPSRLALSSTYLTHAILVLWFVTIFLVLEKSFEKPRESAIWLQFKEATIGTGDHRLSPKMPHSSHTNI